MEFMASLPDKSIDLILTDPPYQTTDCAFDKIKIDWNKHWEQWRRIIKDNGSIVIFSQMPFTTVITYPALDIYRHRWIWQKDKCGNFLAAKGQPLKYTEDINVFSKTGYNQPHNAKNKSFKSTYNPQFRDGSGKARGTDSQRIGLSINKIKDGKKKYRLKSDNITDGKVRYPQDILFFNVPFSRNERIHPTQKPVDLIGYLMNTYSNTGDRIFDPFGGSGTSAIAADILNRNLDICELDKEYFDMSVKRYNTHISQTKLF